MSTYVIGDVQGCFVELTRLLDRVRFKPAEDTVLLLGDLVNRGPQSLEVLRLVRDHAGSMSAVLGNHDLHFLAVAVGARKPSRGDTFEELLEAPDLPELVDWLRRQPILAEVGEALAVHAGVLPAWTLEDCKKYARELEGVIRGPDWQQFLREMYGNAPARFSDPLSGMPRYRALTKVFTRMRFCAADGLLDLSAKHSADSPPPGMKPWFAHPAQRSANNPVLFGHWAALRGRADVPGVEALDTGCVWGHELTALCLDTGERVSVPSQA